MCLFKDGEFNMDNVKLGRLSTGYFFSAVQMLAERDPESIKSLFNQTEVNDAGIY